MNPICAVGLFRNVQVTPQDMADGEPSMTISRMNMKDKSKKKIEDRYRIAEDDLG